MREYCEIGIDNNGYIRYAAPTLSGIAEMYYEENINENGEQGSGYVIFHEGSIKAYCLNETDPLNCGYKWVTRDWDPNTWYIDTDMNTLSCNFTECGDADNNFNVSFDACPFCVSQGMSNLK